MQNDKIIAAIAAYLEKESREVYSEGNGIIFDFGTKNTGHYTHAGFCQEVATEIAAAIAPLVEVGDISKIRNAFARYVTSEGCSCCRNIKDHEAAERELAELLNPMPYDDGSGWDWGKSAK